MKESPTQPRNPLKCFSFWLLVSGFLSMLSISAIAQTRSPGSSSTFSKSGDQNQYSITNKPAYPEAGEPVQFTGNSQDQVISWEWDFGDGKTSNVRNPRHSYSKPGFYSVTLTTGGSFGRKRARRTIGVMPPTDASFSYRPTSPKIGQLVQFTDTTSGSPTSWLWRFGDGTTSTARNPSHAYRAPTPYTVTLLVGGISGPERASRTLTVSAATSVPTLASSFTHSPDLPAPGQAIQFTDTSTGSPTSWQWDFNDGSTSTVQNPNHTFSNSGSYNVTLVVSNTYGSDSISNNVIVGSGVGSIGTYWVSPTGAATWAKSKSATPLSGTACCSMSTANANASAGDTVYLRGGTYSVNDQAIKPQRSGTADAKITYKAYPGETPAFIQIEDGTWNRVQHAIQIIGRNYIIVDGATGNNLSRWIYISAGACYNEIRNCRFSTVTYDCAIRIWDNTTAASTNNWIHHNVFERAGFVSLTGQDVLSMMQIGADGVADNRTSSHNTIENNIFRYGGHDCTETYTKYNVLKNNFYHNEGWMVAPPGATCDHAPDSNGLYGNRNLSISGDRSNTGMFNLLEGNRFGASGATPDDDGGDALTITSPNNIVRYNEILNGLNNGLLLKIDVAARSDNNRIYNNTIVWNGRYNNSNKPGYIGAQWQGCGIRYYAAIAPATGNVIKNNLLYGNTSGDVDHRVWPPHGSDTTRDNSWGTNWINANGNPLFMDETHNDLASSTKPDLNLTSLSGCIDGATHLALADGSGVNSATLVVKSCDINVYGNPIGASNAAMYFQDGTWGSALTHGVTLFPDWIAIGTVGNVAAIASINYTTNTITLASPMTWNANDKIWLYKDSSGRLVLKGTAPDIGAHEFDKR